MDTHTILVGIMGLCLGAVIGAVIMGIAASSD